MRDRFKEVIKHEITGLNQLTQLTRAQVIQL
jgi:hypothetical protein